MKDEGICPGNVPRFYFDQVCVINVKLNNNNIFLIFIICGQQMIILISTSMLSDVFCSPTAGVEETQTTSSLRSLASPLAGDQLEPSYTPFNSTVDFYTFMWSMGGNFFTQIMISIAGGLKPRKAICSLSINRGGCQANFHHHHHHIHHHHHHHHHHNLPLCYQAKLRRFYFDLRTESCKLFVFGGCQGCSAFIPF